MFKLKFLWQFLGLFSPCFVSVLPTPDVTSICGPETNQTLAQRIQSSQWKASDWLLDQQTEDWGWDFLSTGSAILSLQLANETWKNDLESMEAQLTIKQLNIEVLREISHRHSFKEMSVGKLGYYAMALHASCHNASNFHGHNIMKHLHHRVDDFDTNQTKNYFPYSLALLALCSSGSEVPHSAIATLEEVQGDDGCFPFGVDVTSMAVMAMACMQDSFNSPQRLNPLRDMMRKGSECIMGHQTSDGWFGESNVISTALAAQALIAAGEPPSLWRCEDALYHILDAQEEDGHFGSQGGTIQILPLLSNRHHGSLADVQQDCPVKDVMHGIPLIGRQDETHAVNFEISQELENSVAIFSPFLVDILPGESVYRAMERARQIGYFSFESKLSQFGNYITSINNVVNDNANGLYWFIYSVDENGDQFMAETGAEGSCQ
eukprot:XP_011668720.1 PREDICTED: uncharacterized protein CG3556 isoform X1 [Strongylocentrotus purpuratus]